MVIPLKSPVSFNLGYQGDCVFKTDRHFHYVMNQGVLTLNWIDRVEVFASLGGMEGRFKGMETKKGLTWGVGSQVLLLYWNRFLMGVNAKFQMASLQDFKYREWQIAPAIGCEWKYIRPYLGVAYHSVDLKIGRIKSNHHNPFILYFGVGLTPGKIIALNLEGRVIGEAAFSLSINFRF